MRKASALLLLVGALALVECSDKNSSEPTPATNAIPLNTASVELDGKAFPVDLSVSGAYVLTKSKSLRVALYTSSSDKSVNLLVTDFQNKVEKLTISPTSVTGPFYIDEAKEYYLSYDCAKPERAVEILEFDEIKQTVSGTFSGVVCNGTTVKRITNGRFNLPYKVLP